ncbi:MAG TPA: Fic family protein [Candidatus Paceibacterota bacterium]|nr:Fic family protein [Candidatus Paceibacterota bacterium]
MTLARLEHLAGGIPPGIAWSLATVAESRGRQELFTRQSPQRLKALRENAIIESAVSSNRMEGVEVEPGRVGTVVFGRSLLRDRDEEEVRGYQEALALIHAGTISSVSEESIRRMHALCRGSVSDAGRYKAHDGDIIERHPNGSVTTRFLPVSAAQTPEAMRLLLDLWSRSRSEGWAHPLIAIALFNLDFLCIHPFRDGNGRASRLLLLLQLYEAGYDVGRYISLERLIEHHKDRYYETLKLSSEGWHEDRGDPWPYTGYLLFILKEAYREMEERLGDLVEPRGEKAARVRKAVLAWNGGFRLADLERACPGVGKDWIRAVLFRLRNEGKIVCQGKGKAATWRLTGE